MLKGSGRWTGNSARAGATRLEDAIILRDQLALLFDDGCDPMQGFRDLGFGLLMAEAEADSGALELFGESHGDEDGGRLG